jgi:hypothetical protein
MKKRRNPGPARFLKGALVRIKEEYCESKAEKLAVYVVVEMRGDRVLIQPLEWDGEYPPQEAVAVSMIRPDYHAEFSEAAKAHTRTQAYSKEAYDTHEISSRKWDKFIRAECEPRKNPRHQKLMTAALLKKIPALYTHENTPAERIPIVVKFFSPYSNWTWYATEGEAQGDDFIFFGLVRGQEAEMGYFSLKELEGATSMGGRLPLVERDMYFGRHSLAEALAEQI